MKRKDQTSAAILVVFCALMILLAGNPLQAAEELRGAPFSDPAIRQEMPQEWKTRPLVRKSQTGKPDMIVTLNQQFFEFMVDDIEEYGRLNNLQIEVRRGTCGLSAGMIKNKEGDVGAFCCPPGKSDRLPGQRFHTIGLHPISILVHPDNPTEDLSLAAVRKIFQGEIVDWGEAGWKRLPIRVVARLHCKKRPGHWKLLLKNDDLFSPSATEVGAIEDVFSFIADNPSAIGFEVMWMGSQQEGRVKALAIDGMRPEDLGNLERNEYPLYRTLALTTWEEEGLRHPHAEKLIDFVIAKVEEDGSKEGLLSVSRLRAAGWVFDGDELIGEPPAAGK